MTVKIPSIVNDADVEQLDITPTTGGGKTGTVSGSYNLDTGEETRFVAGPLLPGVAENTKLELDNTGGNVTYDGYTADQMDGDYSYDASTTDTIDGVTAETVDKDYATDVTNVDTNDLYKADTQEAEVYGYTPTEAEVYGYNPTLAEATGYEAEKLNGRADYTPELAEAATWDAYFRAVEQNDLARHHLESMLSSDSDYMKQARTAGIQYANSRGLLNTIMAGRAAQGAAIERAAPIAMQDANTYNQRALADMQYTNQARSDNANNQTRVSIENAGFSNDAAKFAGENARFDVDWGNRSDEFNADAINKTTWNNQDAINSADEFNANAKNQFSIYNNSNYVDALKDLADKQTENSQFNAEQNNVTDRDWMGLLASILEGNANRTTDASMLDTKVNQDTDKFDVGELNDLVSTVLGLNTQIGIDNTHQENTAKEDASDKEYGKDEFNVSESNDAKQDNAEGNLTADLHNDEVDYQKWEKNWSLEAEKKRDEWLHKFDMEKLDYQKISNMQADYVTTMKSLWTEANGYIQEIQGRNDIDGDTKTQLINDAIWMRDEGMRVIGSVYDELPGWDESWNIMEVEGIDDIDLSASADAVAAHGADVQAIFKDELGRDPSEADAAHYATKLAEGMTPDEIRAEIGGSEESGEYKLNQSASEHVDYVEGLFEAFLGRDAEPADVEFYTRAIAKGEKTKAEVKKEILASEENVTQEIAKGNLKPEMFTNDILNAYDVIFSRTPSQQEIDSTAEYILWKAKKEGLTTREAINKDLLAHFQESDEFKNKG